MAKTSVYNQAGEKVTEIDLNAKIFGVEKIDANLIHEAVRAQRSNARSSIAHTKYRGEVAGSGKKPWKQKGTGRARAGSVRSPLWKGGGITFGPRNVRNWSLKINKTSFRKALFTALTDKLNESKLVVVDNFESISKTKELAKRLTDLSAKAGLGKKLLIVVAKPTSYLAHAANNLPNSKVISANQLNVIDILNYDVVITQDAIPVMEKTYLK